MHSNQTSGIDCKASGGISRRRRFTAGWFPWTLPTTSVVFVIYLFAFFYLWDLQHLFCLLFILAERKQKHLVQLGLKWWQPVIRLPRRGQRSHAGQTEQTLKQKNLIHTRFVFFLVRRNRTCWRAKEWLTLPQSLKLLGFLCSHGGRRKKYRCFDCDTNVPLIGSRSQSGCISRPPLFV